MNNLDSFAKDLGQLIGRPTDLRPFVCNGSPLACEVFIVGLNPASPMKTNFWEFWDSATGFDKERWLDVYVAERAARPLKPGKTRRNVVSNSRRVIEWMISSLGPIRCLETNIYSAASEEIRDLDRERRITAPFDFLLERIKPRVLVVHGDAIKHVRRRSLPMTLIETKHFSRGWSRERACELASQVQEALSIETVPRNSL